MSTTSGINGTHRKPPTLPTRRSKSITATSTSSEDGRGDAVGIESRQESNVHDGDSPDDGNDGGSAIVATNADGMSGGNGVEADDEKRIQSPSSNSSDANEAPAAQEEKDEEPPEPLRPAFVLEDIGTIDHPHPPAVAAAENEGAPPHRNSSTSTSVSPHRHRSPSPQSHAGGSGLVVSRRGRSRSPVGLTPHHRSSSNGRHSAVPPPPPTTNPAPPPPSAGRELSDVALAAGEAAAWNTNGGGVGGAYHKPLTRGGRSPSPVSRLPSLNSHSFSFGNLCSSGEGNDIVMGGEEDGCGEEGRGGVAEVLGSFDWNISPDSSSQKRYQEHPSPPLQNQYYGQHHRDGEEGGGRHSRRHHNDRRSSLPAIPHHPQYDQYDDSHHLRHLDDNAGRERYHDQNSSNGGGDGRYYQNYTSSYSSSYHPSSNDHHHHEWHHHPNPPHPHHHDQDQGHSRSQISHDNGGGHHRRDARLQQQHRYHHQDYDRRGQDNHHHSCSSSPGQHHQALFPEHHIMSGHSKDNHHRHRSSSPAANLRYNHGGQRGASPPALGRVLQGGIPQPHHRVGRGGMTSPAEKSIRGVSGDTRRKRKNDNATHRSSVFRGSPTARDSLPQELLLALEEDDDEEENTGSSPNNGKASRSLSPSNAMIVANPSMLGLDPIQIDDACLLQDPMLADDDYLNYANLSFRKSYDLDQVFSFIKEGNAAPNANGKSGDIIQGQMSFNLGFINSKSDDAEERGANDKHGKSSDGGTHKRGESRGSYYNDKNDLLLPCDSSQSMGGLTPINSFSVSGENGNNKNGGTGGIVPLNSMDGMALRAFFSSSPNTTAGGGGGGRGGPTRPLMLGGSTSPTGFDGSPRLRGSSPTMTNAPVVHASTPQLCGHQGPARYGPPLGSSSQCSIDHSGYNGAIFGTPSHGPSSGTNQNDDRGQPQSSISSDISGAGRGAISKGFPNKRIKLSTRHALHPIARDLLNRTGGDFFILLKKLAPCFVGFRFKLPEIELGPSNLVDSRVNSSTNMVIGDSSVHNDSGPRSHGATFINNDGRYSFPPGTAHSDVQMIIAMRRISSSICAFGGSLPPRTVSPFSRSVSISSPSSPNSIHSPSASRAPADADVMVPTFKEETPAEREERFDYEDKLSTRYFMKEHCVSWDVELHKVIASPVRTADKDKVGVSGTPRSSKNKQIGVFKKGELTPTNLKYCAPVTPHTPIASPGSPGEASAPSTPGQPPTGKGTKIKYRCKLCGQPKQNHSCPYESSVVRSIGTMVYPAVNAFVSNEPGRLAPALSEMNNFTSLLSQDTTMAGGNQTGSLPGGGGPAFGTGVYRHHQHPSHHSGGPYAGNLLTPDTVHWSPNTPGGLSTMSSVDPNSPGAPPPLGTPGGSTGSMVNTRYQGGNPRRRDYHHPLMSQSMTRTMSTPLSGHPVPRAPSMPLAPAGAIPSDVLFRDTMELKPEQFRAVRPPTATTSGNDDDSIVEDGHAIMDSPNAYRYPAIPTPYSQRKEMGDTLFALSREVPKLADSCAAILRDARERDLWDQAVAELTTQVIVVLKCEERDYTLEGLRRHLLTLGIAC